VKARLETAYGEWVERIPAWIKWASQVITPYNHSMATLTFNPAASNVPAEVPAAEPLFKHRSIYNLDLLADKSVTSN
jgi:hypothetical protein